MTKVMASSSNPQDMFNDAFKLRFDELSRLYETPSSSSDVSFIDVASLPKPSTTAAKMPMASCATCETIAKPMPCAQAPKSVSGTSWILGLLLVVGIFLVIFGIYQLFRSSSDRNRRPLVFPQVEVKFL